MVKKLPPFIRYPMWLLLIVILYLFLHHAKALLAPIALAIIIALAVYPVFEFFVRKGIPEVPAIIATILSVFLVLGIVGTIVYFQLINLIEDSPAYLEQIERHLFNIQIYIEDTFDVNAEEQTQYISEQTTQLISSIPDILFTLINSLYELLLFTFLIIVYVFFFIYNRERFKNFLIEILPMQEKNLRKFYSTTNDTVQNYIGGLFFVMLILAVLNSIALIIIGIDHPIFFGVLAALLTVIPYIGVFIGSSLPVMFALITKDSLLYPIAIMITFDVIQFLEGNFITPNVMGNKVNLSPLMIILVLFIGGIIWGPVGMILAVPYLAILKIIIGSNKDLKPYEEIMTGYTYEGEDSLLKRLYIILRKGWRKISTR